jgi:hypothetical protein
MKHFQFESARICRLLATSGVVLILIVIFGGILVAKIGEYRARARDVPKVWASGQGSATHYFYQIQGGGQPGQDLDDLVARAVDQFVVSQGTLESERAKVAEQTSIRYVHDISLKVSCARISRTSLGQLREFPNLHGVALYLTLDAREIADDCLAELCMLHNVTGITFEGVAVQPTQLAALQTALPECAIIAIGKCE